MWPYNSPGSELRCGQTLVPIGTISSEEKRGAPHEQNLAQISRREKPFSSFFVFSARATVFIYLNDFDFLLRRTWRKKYGAAKKRTESIGCSLLFFLVSS